ncbi:MAG: hypothetical protein ACM3IK_15890 [Sphingomonadaceae bacterium]|jgi:hypothetical protein
MKRSLTTLSVAALTAATAALPFAVPARAAAREGNAMHAAKCSAKKKAKCSARPSAKCGANSSSKSGMCGGKK